MCGAIDGADFWAPMAAFALRRAVAQLILIEAGGQPRFAATLLPEVFSSRRKKGTRLPRPARRQSWLCDVALDWSEKLASIDSGASYD